MSSNRRRTEREGDERDADERRFQALHAQTYPDLLRFVLRRVPDSDAEDVVSTVFLTAWRRLPDVPDDARPWLFGVARNVITNHSRSTARRGSLDVRVGLEHRTQEAGDSASAVDLRLDLLQAWRTLCVQDRETLALVAFDGLTAQQAAGVLKCSRSTFSMRLGRARRRLRQALDGPARPREQTTAPTSRATTSPPTRQATRQAVAEDRA